MFTKMLKNRGSEKMFWDVLLAMYAISSITMIGAMLYISILGCLVQKKASWCIALSLLCTVLSPIVWGAAIAYFLEEATEK